MTQSTPLARNLSPLSLAPLSWAVCVAASWTWCIGMFLPVLLVRDYGIWAWVAFAIPNILGAGAVGWVVRDAQMSRRMIERHMTAFIAFSWVTIAFQAFFIVWILQWFSPALDTTHLLLLLVCAVALGRPASGVFRAWIVLPMSYAIGLYALSRHWIPALPTPVTPSIPRLGGLFAACMLGFGLCPYLDLTFHLARQRTTVVGGRIAFTLGFGLLFVGMVLFTLGYSGYFTGTLDQIPPTFRLLLPLHLVVQAAFTIGMHLEALRTLELPGAVRPRTYVEWAIGIGAVCGFIAHQGGAVVPLASGRGEVLYRLFMGGYGLFFPAYIWLRMRSPAASPRVVIGTIVLASPFIAVAFLSPPAMAWALPGVVIVLLADLFRRRGQSPSPVQA